MRNEHLIKMAQIWALGVTLAACIFAFSGNVESAIWNSHQQNANSNTAAQNSNAEKQTGAATTSASPDQKFLMEAAMAGLLEVELGRWAAQIGTSDAVKQFGRRMVTDHTKANDELKQLATSKGITLPTALDQKNQLEVSKLARMKGADFDKGYSKKMLSEHNKAVSLFQKESTKGADPDVKAFATKALPTLQEHLDMAKALAPTSAPKNSNTPSNSNSNSNRP